jgi:WD40 repeat protein
MGFFKKKIVSSLIVFVPILVFSSFMVLQDENEHNIFVSNSCVRNQLQPVAFNEYDDFTILKGHAAGVRDVAFSPDGKYLASAGGFDRTIRIWNTSDGSLLSVLYGHLSFIKGLCFSNDGLLASTARDGFIKIWNITSNTVLRTLPIQDQYGDGIVFSPDGELLVSGEGELDGDSGSVRIWNLTSGLIIRNLTQNNKVNVVVFSPLEENLLAFGSRDGSIKFWNISTGEELNNLVGHTGAVKDIAFSPDGKSLASASRDGTIKLWNTSTGALITTLESNEEVVLAVCFFPDGLLASGGGKFSPWPLNNAEIKIWNITTGTPLSTLTGHTNSIMSLDISPDGTILASGSEDWTIRLWGNPPQIQPRSPFWHLTNPEEQGLNSTVLDELSEILSSNPLMHSFLVLHKGSLVMEEYYKTSSHIYSRECKHYLYSCTKSVTSLLIGIAIDQGYIDNVGQKVLDFFPDRNISNMDPKKEVITLEHLLTMTSGLDWYEWTVSPYGNNYYEMVRTSDWVQYVLDRPMDSDPGTIFNYNSGGSHLLSAIIQNITGRTTLSFAQEFLFDPLNITFGDYIWYPDPTGIVNGGTGLYLTAQDMLKIGYLYLNNGTWPFSGQQVVSTEWIVNATSKNPHLGSTDQYGYQVWFTEFAQWEIKGYRAWGSNEQNIYIIPDLDLVVVYTSDGTDLKSLISDYVFASIYPPVSSTTRTTTTTIDTIQDSTTISTNPLDSGFEPFLLIVVVIILKKGTKRRKKGMC